MDFRALLAAISAAAGIGLLSVAAINLFRHQKPRTMLWVYALLFVAVGIVLYQGSSLHRLPLPEPSEVTMMQPEDFVTVQLGYTLPPDTSIAPKRTRRSHAPEPMTSDWQLYYALSRAFDSIETFFYRNGTPVIGPDSLPALRLQGTETNHIPGTPAPRRKSPL